MFEFVNSALKSTAAVADIPVSAAKDVITIGGALEEKETTYTGGVLGEILPKRQKYDGPE